MKMNMRKDGIGGGGMVSHFSTLGLAIPSKADFMSDAELVCRSGQRAEAALCLVSFG